MKINKYIDHTLLKATASKKEIIQLCKEAKEHQFYAVCVNGCYVELAKENVQNTKVKIAAVIGFPLGAMTTTAKVFEAKDCIAKGADEIDMVINIGMLQSGEYKYVENEIRLIKEAIGNNILKVIFENCYLTSDEKKIVNQLAVNAKADFVKTATGFGTGGATFADVQQMKDIVGDNTQIKAAGGVRDIETAMKYIKMGVTRLGTSSGVSLVTKGVSETGKY